MASKSYADAVDKLNSLQSNAATLEALRATGGRINDLAIPEMVEYLERIGHTVSPTECFRILNSTCLARQQS